MPPHFDPQLVNDPFGDPGLYVDLIFERRALLFDLGNLSPLSPRKLLRVSDVFVTHRHMDHFAGFDQLLACLLGREKTVRIYGPQGLIDAIDNKLKAYTWNLIEGYDGNLVFDVKEVDEAGRLATACFSGRTRFERSEGGQEETTDGILLREPGLEVRAATLDHGVLVLAFAFVERAHINIWRNKVEAMGLVVGPWLRALKDAILRGEPDETAIEALSLGPAGQCVSRSIDLGTLKREIMQVTSGRKIAYVVDCAFTDANAKKIISLAREAYVLYIEAPFLEKDAERAAARRHLTAHQAGTLARLANVKRLVTLHYSPRYQGRGECLAREAQDAFKGEELSS